MDEALEEASPVTGLTYSSVSIEGGREMKRLGLGCWVTYNILILSLKRKMFGAESGHVPLFVGFLQIFRHRLYWSTSQSHGFSAATMAF